MSTFQFARQMVSHVRSGARSKWALPAVAACAVTATAGFVVLSACNTSSDERYSQVADFRLSLPQSCVSFCDGDQKLANQTILCGDIGGTNTRLRLYSVDSFGKAHEISNKKYENESHSSLLSVIQQFLKDSEASSPASVPSAACLAVAGPVTGQKAVLTNRVAWSIDGDAIADSMGIKKVKVVNDFVGMGYGLLTLDHDTECVKLHGPDAPPHSAGAPIACIGPGTGLGQCFLTPISGSSISSSSSGSNSSGSGSGNCKYACYPSEGGHSEFAPRTELELEMLKYLRGKFESKHRISVERVISGTGLANIYEFLCFQFPNSGRKDVQAEVQQASDATRGAVIAGHADDDPLCGLTMRLFTAAYGSEAGVAMLKWMPTGGLYLTGGLTAKNLSYITGEKPGTKGIFKEAMLDKGRVSPMLQSVPVYAVVVEDLGERGALHVALQLLRDE